MIMLKSILNVQGAQGLSKNEQKEINGGMIVQQLGCGTPESSCPPGYCCGRGSSSRYVCVVPERFGINCL